MPMRDEQFERLYEEYAQRLFGFLAYRTGDRTLAEDLLADTFERALRGRRGFDRRKASEKTWLYSIALNLLRDHARRQAAEGRALERKQASEPGSESDHALEDIERDDDLQRALATLSGEEREAIALRFGADLTVPEIAKLSNQSLTTVEGRVYRALRKLREQLGEGARDGHEAPVVEASPDGLPSGNRELRSGIGSLVRISR
jgi:RNA polymerase sigma-70 factor (ECF subfamily)